MIDFKKHKQKLKYHRIVTLCIVFTYIVIQYKYSTSEYTHENGVPKVEGERKNGVNEGLWTWYYDNGNKQMQGYFKKGKRNGKWVMWSKSGTVISEYFYDADRLNGPYTQWYSEKRIKSKGEYINDRLNGTIVNYDTSGMPQSIEIMENGKLIKKIK